MTCQVNLSDVNCTTVRCPLIVLDECLVIYSFLLLCHYCIQPPVWMTISTSASYTTEKMQLIISVVEAVRWLQIFSFFLTLRCQAKPGKAFSPNMHRLLQCVVSLKRLKKKKSFSLWSSSKSSKATIFNTLVW